MDVVVWLRSLGLGKYEAAQILGRQVRQDLFGYLVLAEWKELGVAALGHRRTLLDAIAALRNVHCSIGIRSWTIRPMWRLFWKRCYSSPRFAGAFRLPPVGATSTRSPAPA